MAEDGEVVEVPKDVDIKDIDFADNIIKISAQKKTGFYVRAGQNFLQGVKDKDGNDKPAFPSIVFSALGAAISTCASVCDILERREIAEIVKIQTDYVALDGGGNRRPQLRVELKAKSVGPPTPERLLDAKMEKKMKKVNKEGGKRGVEIEGAASMGGLAYFNTKVEEPEGDLDMLVECVKSMNAPCDPSEEERKGGAGGIGKLVMSFHDDALCLCAYVPPSGTGKNKANEWLESVVKLLEVPGGAPALREDSGANYAMVAIKKNVDAGVFPIKFRDVVITHANNTLRKMGLFPDESDEDEDEMVFGDEDFPEF